MAAKKKSRRWSFLVRFCALALCVSFVISFFSLRKEISEKKEQIAVVLEEKKEQEAKNDALRYVVESGDIDEYAESIARDKFGYVKQGERAYFDISVNN